MDKNIQINLYYVLKQSNNPLIQKHYEGLKYLTPVMISAAKL